MPEPTITPEPAATPESVATPESFLTGRVDHALDEKGRITLPAGSRATFKASVYFVPSSHGEPYVRLYDFPRWKAFDEKYIASLDEVANREADNQIGDLYESMYRVVPDKQGRLVVPQEFIDSLGLEEKVRITGHRDHLRLWHPAVHDRHRAERARLRAEAAAGSGAVGVGVA